MKFLLIFLLAVFSVNGFAEENGKHSPGHEKNFHTHDGNSESNHEKQEAKEEHEHEEGEEEELSSSVGADGAVTEADHEKGFKLSEKAVATLGVQLQQLSSYASVSLPKNSVIHFQDETGIYRYREGWFKLIEGEFTDAGNQKVVFQPHQAGELKKGDQVAISGVALLRVTELDVFAGAEAGHGH